VEKSGKWHFDSALCSYSVVVLFDFIFFMEQNTISSFVVALLFVGYRVSVLDQIVVLEGGATEYVMC
jgi:hypothetical protein